MIIRLEEEKFITGLEWQVVLNSFNPVKCSVAPNVEIF